MRSTRGYGWNVERHQVLISTGLLDKLLLCVKFEDAVFKTYATVEPRLEFDRATLTAEEWEELASLGALSSERVQRIDQGPTDGDAEGSRGTDSI
jgi:hypothetical protein